MKMKYECEVDYDEPLKLKQNLGNDFKSLFDLCFMEQELKWIPWTKTIPSYVIPVGK